MGMDNKVEVITDLFQDYNTKKQFDIILMHYSINHIDEPNCITLEESTKSQEIYAQYFEKLNHLLINNGDLLITDVSRNNFFDLIKLKNPFVPTIEWEKHQSPHTWVKHLERQNFHLNRLVWTSPNKLKYLHPLLNNFIFLYFTTSLFMFHMKKIKNI